MKLYVTPKLVCLFLKEEIVRTSEQNPVSTVTTDDYFTDEWWKA